MMAGNLRNKKKTPVHFFKNVDVLDDDAGDVNDDEDNQDADLPEKDSPRLIKE